MLFIFGKADWESNVGGSVTLHPILAYGTFSARTLMILFLQKVDSASVLLLSRNMDEKWIFQRLTGTKLPYTLYLDIHICF